MLLMTRPQLYEFVDLRRNSHSPDPNFRSAFLKLTEQRDLAAYVKGLLIEDECFRNTVSSGHSVDIPSGLLWALRNRSCEFDVAHGVTLHNL
jgi:hypothetical protein